MKFQKAVVSLSIVLSFTACGKTESHVDSLYTAQKTDAATESLAQSLENAFKMTDSGRLLSVNSIAAEFIGKSRENFQNAKNESRDLRAEAVSALQSTEQKLAALSAEDPEREKLVADRIALEKSLELLASAEVIKEQTKNLKRKVFFTSNAVPNFLDSCRRKTGSALKSSLNETFAIMDEYRLHRCKLINRSQKLGSRLRSGKFSSDNEIKNAMTNFADLGFMGIELTRNFLDEISEAEMTELIQDQAAADEGYQNLRGR